MNTDLIWALAIPWVFWGILTGLLIMARRSWINMLLIPIGITVLILMIARLAPAWKIFWISLVSHLVLLFYFVWSVISLELENRREKTRQPGSDDT